jgi:hypothetical protein
MKRNLIALAIAGLTLAAGNAVANDATDVFADSFWKAAPEATALVQGQDAQAERGIYSPFDSYAQ